MKNGEELLNSEEFKELNDEMKWKGTDDTIRDKIKEFHGKDQLKFIKELIDLGLMIVVSKNIESVDEENKEIVSNWLIDFNK